MHDYTFIREPSASLDSFKECAQILVVKPRWKGDVMAESPAWRWKNNVPHSSVIQKSAKLNMIVDSFHCGDRAKVKDEDKLEISTRGGNCKLASFWDFFKDDLLTVATENDQCCEIL